MARKLMNEEKVRNAFCEVLLEDSATHDVIAKEVKKVLKNSEVSKDIEKQVKDIVAKCINNLFKTLWFRHNFYEDEIKR